LLEVLEVATALVAVAVEPVVIFARCWAKTLVARLLH
jgi:hypothetical protein